MAGGIDTAGIRRVRAPGLRRWVAVLVIIGLGAFGLSPSASAATDAYRTLISDDGAVAYWSFDGACVAPCITNSDIGGRTAPLTAVTDGILPDTTPGIGAMGIPSDALPIVLAQAPVDDLTIEAWVSDDSLSVAGLPLQGPLVSNSGLTIEVEIVDEFSQDRVLRFRADSATVGEVELGRQHGYGDNGAIHVAMTFEGSVVTAFVNGASIGQLETAGLGLDLARSAELVVGGADVVGDGGPDGPDGGGGLPPDDGGGGLGGPGGGFGGAGTTVGVLDELAFYESALTPAQLAAHYRLIAPLGLEVIVGAGNSGADVIATLVFTNYGPNSLTGFGDSGVAGTVGGGGLLQLIDPIDSALFNLGSIESGESRQIQRLFSIIEPDPDIPPPTEYLIAVETFLPRQSFLESVQPVSDPLGTGVPIDPGQAVWFFPGEAPAATHPACLSNVSDTIVSFVVTCWSDEDARQVYIDALIADGFEDGVDDVIWIGNYDEEPVRP